MLIEVGFLLVEVVVEVVVVVVVVVVVEVLAASVVLQASAGCWTSSHTSKCGKSVRCEDVVSCH